MREKTSITLSPDVIVEIDRHVGSRRSRSAFIEEVLRHYFRERAREAINARDVEIINANADALNREAMDVLRYQASIDWSSEE